MLVPGLAAGATAELDGLRAACDAAVTSLLSVEHDLLAVVGSAPTTRSYAADAWGSLRPYGSPVDLPAGPGAPTLPLSLTIGRWLLDRSRPGAAAMLLGVAGTDPAESCLGLGEEVAGSADRVALLVMGDASGRRTPKPGYLDPRAEPFDDAVTTALREIDIGALARLDVDLAADLLVEGRAAWQVLAGAARGSAGDLGGQVLWAGAPYGVTYLVATWS